MRPNREGAKRWEDGGNESFARAKKEGFFGPETEKFFGEYVIPYVESLSWSLTQDDVAAEEAQSHAVMAFFENREKLDEGKNLKQWLAQTVANKIRDHCKKRKKMISLDEKKEFMK